MLAVKLTPTDRAVLRVLCEAPEPVTRVRLSIDTSYALTTVYRSLKIMTAGGCVELCPAVVGTRHRFRITARGRETLVSCAGLGRDHILTVDKTQCRACPAVLPPPSKGAQVGTERAG